VPDIIAAYTMKQDWGHVKVAGIFRQLAYNVGDIDASDTGAGVSVTGKVKVSDTDDIRFTFFTGTGLGRYAALNAAQGAVYNDQTGELSSIASTGYGVAYRHMWTDKARSSIMFSAFDADADEVTKVTMGDYTEKTYSARVNYIYSMSKTMTVGAEYAYAKRETDAGLEGDMSRVQFSAKYAF
jgi:outer membrane protein assembly factor BamA